MPVLTLERAQVYTSAIQGFDFLILYFSLGAELIESRRKRHTKNEVSREISINLLTKAAFELFVVHGYHATSLEAISSKVGLSKGSVYYYFGSKEKLILHMLGVIRQDLVDGLIDDLLEDTENNHVDRIIRYIHTGANFGAQRPNELLFMILISIEFARQDNPIAEAIKALYRDLFQAVESVVIEAQKRGAMPIEVDARSFASMIVAVHDGMMLAWHLRRTEINGSDLVRHVRNMLLHGIA